MSPLTAVILARGGSKSLPSKNLRALGRVPLVAWVIRAAGGAECVGQVLVVTDDDDVAEVVERHGALVIAEPPELAADDVGDLPVLCFALGALGMKSGLLVHLRATSPLVRACDIAEVVGLLSDHRELTSVRSVRPAREHPRKMYREAAPLRGVPTLTPYTGAAHAANSPRQGLEPVWAAAGYCDALRAEVVLGPDGPEGLAIGRWEVPADRDLDIDTPEDWRVAERLVRRRAWRPGE